VCDVPTQAVRQQGRVVGVNLGIMPTPGERHVGEPLVDDGAISGPAGVLARARRVHDEEQQAPAAICRSRPSVSPLCPMRCAVPQPPIAAVWCEAEPPHFNEIIEDEPADRTIDIGQKLRLRQREARSRSVHVFGMNTFKRSPVLSVYHELQSQVVRGGVVGASQTRPFLNLRRSRSARSCRMRCNASRTDACSC
jgi:hypothetical protein